MGKITTDDIDESLMIEAGETRTSIWDPFTTSHSVVFQVPLLHLIAYIFSNLVAKRTRDNEDTITGHEDRPAVEKTFGDGIRSNWVGLISLPLKLLFLVEAIITLDVAFTTTAKSCSLRSLVFHITRDVDPH